MKFSLILVLTFIIGCINQDRNCKYSIFKQVEKIDDVNLDLQIAHNDFGMVNNCAKIQNKPVLTIYWTYTTNSDIRGTWIPLADEEINSILQEDFLIRTYILDSRMELPDSIQSKSSATTIGNYFADKQLEKYKVIGLPFYTITDWKEKDLTAPIGYIPKKEISRFQEFIKEGKATYANKPL